MGDFEDTLAHFGVKGMHWGVRKGKKSGPTDVKVKSRFGNRLVTTRGGKGHKLSEDATRAAILRQKTKKSNIRSLSNKELQDLITRMNLEQQFDRLNKGQLQRGEDTVKNILATAALAKQTYSEVKSALGN